MKINSVLLFLSIVSLFTSAMANGDAAAGKQKSAICAACHGADGNSTNPEWPKLAGQSEQYLIKQLKDFKQQKRVNPLMAGPIAGLSEQDMEDLAAYFASQKAIPGSADSALVKSGEHIYRGGNIERGVAACMACHSPTGSGNPAAVFPRLSGQHGKYVANQLRSFRDNERKNDRASMMRSVANKMTIEEINAISNYIAGLH